MSNRYKDAIEAMADILKARAKIEEKLRVVRRSLMISEITDTHGHCLDGDLLQKTFDGSRVRGTKLLIDECRYIQSQLTITNIINVPLHENSDEASKVVIHRLCDEVGINKILAL
jgi:hypothetical protein